MLNFTALALSLTFTSPAAFAADYPYSGFFTMLAADKSLQQAQPFCGYNFFVQGKDGSYVDYHLDLQKYRADGSIRFVVYGRGSCAVDASGKIETCISTFDSDPSEQGKSYFDVFRRLAADVVEVYFFDGLLEAQAFALTGANPKEVQPQHFNQCLDFVADKMSKYLSADISTLSPDERLKLTSPEPDQEAIAIMTRVLETIRADSRE